MLSTLKSTPCIITCAITGATSRQMNSNVPITPTEQARAIERAFQAGARSLIGINSDVFDRVSIGCDCIVSAGSLVTKSPTPSDGVVLRGVPAKFYRETHPEEIEQNIIRSQRYTQTAQLYQRSFRKIEL